jgi:hypothetical protein
MVRGDLAGLAETRHCSPEVEIAAHRVDRAVEAVVAAVIIVYRALMVARDQHHRTVLDPAKVGPAKDVAQPGGPAPATRDAKGLG